VAVDTLQASGSQSPGWRLIRQVVREQRVGISFGVLSGLSWSAGKIAVPALVRQAIDRGLHGASGPPLRWASAIFGAGLVAALFTGLRRYLAFREGRRAEAALRLRLFAHLERLHFGFHDRVATGELMSRCNADLLQVQNFITLIPLTISNAMIVIAVTSIMLSIHAGLTILALGSLPFVNVLGRRFAQRLFPTLRALQEETAQLASVVEESVAGVRAIKGFGAERLQQSKLAKEAGDVYDMAMRAAQVRASFLPAIELVPNLGQIFVLAYGGHLVLNDRLSLGTLIMFNFYVIVLVNPLRMLGQIIAQAERAAAAAGRVSEVLAQQPAIVDPPEPKHLPVRGPRRGELRFEHVGFGFAGQTGPQVLSDFNLRIAPGQSLALVGATGAGKSTVAKLIGRFYDVDAGRVLLDGVDVRSLRLQELRSQIAIVFEDTFLFHDTVAANIAFARPDASPADIERAARRAAAHDFICELPQGYQTLLGERGFSLSGGQRQRISIARAMLADPRVLILDDATSSVDPEKEHEILGALADVMQQRTTLVISHRPATIALAERLVLLADGGIVADGTHAQLLREDARYQHVLAAAPHVAGVAP
jgi:ATP-binding cassette subfamily B protein